MVIGREFWLHALAVGTVAREINAALGMRGTDAVFSFRLFHDIGGLLLLRAEPVSYAAIIEKNDRLDLSADEKDVFGFDYAQVSAIAAKRSKLSEAVCNINRYHHNPAE